MRLPTQLLHRRANAHKGDFGHIFILGGCARYSGAPVLCGAAAMRSGAGLVTLGIPKSLNNAVIKIKPKEIMTLPLPETNEVTIDYAAYKKIEDFAGKVDVMVVGPGLSQNRSTQKLIRKVISSLDVPSVIDADGLNALAGHLNLLRNTYRNAKILTPHPGEMSGLTAKSVANIQSKRKETAARFARDNKVTLVLKGLNTVVADQAGSIYVNRTGNPGMATAGSGDCLTGIIAAFLGQGLNAFNASKFAVYLHGLAGDLAAGEKTQISLIASDIIDKIPDAIKRCS